MYRTKTLKNGLTLITIDIPRLESVTSMVAVGAGSRYETKKISGLSHFLEHMFFKGSRKYPTAEQIATLVDGIGAVNNAATDKEVTYYWIKSAAKHIELSSDILSSMLKESLFAEEEIEREKGVIIEEIRMYQDNPSAYVLNLYEQLQFGDQPIGWDVIGKEKIIHSLTRDDFINYMNSLYSPKNMALVYAGKIPEDIEQLAEKYFLDLPERSQHPFEPFKPLQQIKSKVDIHYKKTDQINLVMGVQAYDRKDSRRYAARILGIILGEGMSSRLFVQIRMKRGLAYHVMAFHYSYQDTGFFGVYGGLKLEKVDEALKIILDELERVKDIKVTDDELKKAKEIERGRLAIRSESTNFLAEYFGLRYILEGELETFDDYMKKIDAVTVEDIQAVAKDLFQRDRYNLQIIGPLKDKTPFEKILS